MAFLTHKCSIRKTLLILVLLVLIAAGGGILLWKFLPQQHRNTANDIANGAFIPVKGDAPPPNYIFNRCSDPTNCCNGLQSNCDKGVNDILYAGVHNAQSTAQDGFFIAPNHQFNVVAALDYGYRVINFDIGVCSEGRYELVHGPCKLGTKDPTEAFTSVQTWLDENTNEVVIIPLEINNAASDLENVDLGKLYNLLLEIPGFTDRMYQLPTDGTWPTLREMIDLDQRILLFHYNGGRCDSGQVTCPPGFHDWFAYTGESKFNFKEEEEFDFKASACNITRGRVRGPFYALNAFMTIPSRDVSSNLLNTKAFLQDHIQACTDVNPGLDVNIVFVDFWSEGNLPEVVQIHNNNLASQSENTNARLLN